MSEKKTQDALLEAIDIMIENKLKKLKFNYYVDGVIVKAQSSQGVVTYDVMINGVEYANVPTKNNLMYSVGDSVQILIKNGDWNKKFIDDRITHSNVPKNLLNNGIRKPIPNNADFNNYVDVGCFCVNTNAGMLTLSNRPCNYAGILDVEDAVGTSSSSNDNKSWRYRIQRYTNLDGDIYYRRCVIGTEESNWSFGAWIQILNTRTAIDYVVEQGKNGIWTYTKWASGKAECWGTSNVTIDATSAWGTALFYGSASQIPLPFKFTEAPFCQITCEHGTSAQSVFVMSHGKATQTTTPTCTVARATSSSNVNCNILYHVVGKWK